MKVYCEAQEFGLGPSALLFVAIEGIRRANSTAKILVRENLNTAAFGHETEKLDIQFCQPIALNDCDRVLSALDPVSIIRGRMAGKPTMILAEIFGFWDISDRIETVSNHYDLIEKKLHYNREDSLDTLLNIYQSDPHLAIILGHLLADQCLVVDTAAARSMVNRLSHLFEPKFVGYPLSTNINVARQEPQNIIVFQVPGGINPITTLEERVIYASFCIKMAKRLAEKFINFSFIIRMPQFLTKEIEETPCQSNVHIEEMTSQSEYFELIGKSHCLFTTSGTQTIYEATAIGCPVFLLPEDNAAKYYCLSSLNLNVEGIERYIIEETYPKRERLPCEDDAHALHTIIDSMLSEESKPFNIIVSKAHQFIENIADYTYRNNYLNFITACLETDNKQTPFNGTEVVQWINENG